MESWPKRAEVAELLGVSVSTVRRLERDGTLRAVVDAEGATRIDPGSIRPTQNQRRIDDPELEPDGEEPSCVEVEARVFAALGRGMAPVQIVYELGIPSADVLAAVDAWGRLTEAWPGPPPPVVVVHLKAIEGLVRELFVVVDGLDRRLAEVEAAILPMT